MRALVGSRILDGVVHEVGDGLADQLAVDPHAQALDRIRFEREAGLLGDGLVELGNVGDETALPALLKAANDAEELIAEHASWAIAQIHRRTARINGDSTKN